MVVVMTETIRVLLGHGRDFVIPTLISCVPIVLYRAVFVRDHASIFTTIVLVGLQAVSALKIRKWS